MGLPDENTGPMTRNPNSGEEGKVEGDTLDEMKECDDCNEKMRYDCPQCPNCGFKFY